VTEKLAKNGVAIVDTRSDKTTVDVYRLVVGTFATLDAAQKCLQKVAPQLKHAYLISHNGVHGVYSGSWYKRATAQEHLDRYQVAGIPLTIRRDTVDVIRTTILAGSYTSRDAARDISLSLRRLGIPSTIVSGAESLALLRSAPKPEDAV
jgi:hypothetical protein